VGVIPNPREECPRFGSREYEGNPAALVFGHALHPAGRFRTVGWITEYTAKPRENKPVVRSGEMVARGGPRSNNRSARIKVERPESFEQVRRRQPLLLAGRAVVVEALK